MNEDRITYQEGGWHFTCARMAASTDPTWDYLAMAKRTPFLNFHPIYEPGEVWFEYGRTPAEALQKLGAEVGALNVLHS